MDGRKERMSKSVEDGWVRWHTDSGLALDIVLDVETLRQLLRHCAVVFWMCDKRSACLVMN